MTDASGAYLFQNLPSGSYRITETPPSGYVNDASQPNSPLTPIISQTSNSIEVQLSDPSQLQVSYPSHNKETLTITSNPPLSTPTGLVGQLNITVNEPDISYTTSLFPSFCVDLYRDIYTGDTNLPYSMEPLSRPWRTIQRSRTRRTLARSLICTITLGAPGARTPIITSPWPKLRDSSSPSGSSSMKPQAHTTF